MSIEKRLRQNMAAQDPGLDFTSAVMGRVRPRSRTLPWAIVAGALLFTTAAAAMLGLKWFRHGEAPALASVATSTASSATASMSNTDIPRVETGANSESPALQQTQSNGSSASRGHYGGSDIQALDLEKQRSVLAGGGAADEVQIARQLGKERYPDVQKELALSQAEADSLYTLLLRQSRETEIEAQLGTTKYQQWKDYQSTMDSNRRVNTLRTNLANSGDPLRDDQARALTATILAEQRRRNSEMRLHSYPTNDARALLDQDEQNINVTEASYRRIVDAAKSYLSPQQLFLMQNSMNQTIVSQRQGVAERRAVLEGRATAPASSHRQ